MCKVWSPRCNVKCLTSVCVVFLLSCYDIVVFCCCCFHICICWFWNFFNKIISTKYKPVCTNLYKIRDTLIYWRKSSFKVLYHWCFIAVYCIQYVNFPDETILVLYCIFLISENHCQTINKNEWIRTEIRMNKNNEIHWWGDIKLLKKSSQTEGWLAYWREIQVWWNCMEYLLYLVDKWNIASLKMKVQILRNGHNQRPHNI